MGSEKVKEEETMPTSTAPQYDKSRVYSTILTCMSPFKPLIPISKSLETLDNERFVPLGTFISFLKEYIAQKGEFCNVPGKVDVECNVRASQYRFICEYGDGEYIILFRQFVSEGCFP